MRKLEGGDGTRTGGLDWQIRGFAGVTSASIVPSDSRLVSHGDCAFLGERKLTAHYKGAAHFILLITLSIE